MNLTLAQITSLPADLELPTRASNSEKGAHWVITGGLGFLGIHLVELLTRRDIKVYLVSRKSANNARDYFDFQTRFYQLRPNRNLVYFIQGDMSQHNWGIPDPDWEICCAARYVINLAAELNVAKALSALHKSNSLSINPTFHLLANGVKVMHLSTLSVFASSNWPTTKLCTESYPFYNETFYGGYAQSKILAEHYLKTYYTTGSLVICRPTLIIGSSKYGIAPHQDLQYALLEGLRTIGGIPPHIPPEQVNQCPVDWVAEKIYQIALTMEDGLRYLHLANKSHTSLAETIYPLNLPTISEPAFIERIKLLPPLQQVLIRNAFYKPQPLRYWNYDIFHSTKRVYQSSVV